MIKCLILCGIPFGKKSNYPHYNDTGVLVMKNTSFNITVPHFFSPKSAFSAESSSYIVRFNVHNYISQNITSLYQRIVAPKSVFH